MRKMGKNIPPLINKKLSKKSQEKDDKIKRNLQTADQNYNYCRFQIYWNMLEWVNPRSKIVGK